VNQNRSDRKSRAFQPLLGRFPYVFESMRLIGSRNPSFPECFRQKNILGHLLCWSCSSGFSFIITANFSTHDVVPDVAVMSQLLTSPRFSTYDVLAIFRLTPKKPHNKWILQLTCRPHQRPTATIAKLCLALVITAPRYLPTPGVPQLPDTPNTECGTGQGVSPFHNSPVGQIASTGPAADKLKR